MSAIADSAKRSYSNFARLQQYVSHKTHDQSARYSHLDYLVQVPAKSSPNSNILVTGGTVDFELKNLPSSMLKDDHSIYVVFRVTNTDGTNAVTPVPVESFFDRTSAIEWQLNSRQLTNPWSNAVIALEPALHLPDDSYSSLCNVLNHNTSLASPTSLVANASDVFIVRIPTILPADGFWY